MKNNTNYSLFIGIYSRSVIATYLAVAIALCAIPLTYTGYINYAMVCLLIAGLLDMIDGPIARAMKRTNNEKQFGVQIDSLADIISFCTVPVVLSILNDHIAWYCILAYIVFILAGITRLAIFNVAAQQAKQTYYNGLPVTAVAFLAPLVYYLHRMSLIPTSGIFTALLFVCVAMLFVANIRIPKPGLRGSAIIAVYVCIISLLIIVGS